MDIGPGDWVEFIATHGPSDQLVTGQLYRVHSLPVLIFGGCLGCGKIYPAGIELEGIIASEGYGFSPCVLRPIYRPDPLLIEALKAEPIDAEWVPMARCIANMDAYVAQHGPYK